MSRNRLPSPEQILGFIASPRYRPMRRAELCRAFELSGDDARDLRKTLKELERAGRLVRVKGSRYAVPAEVNLVTGKLQVQIGRAHV